MLIQDSEVRIGTTYMAETPDGKKRLAMLVGVTGNGYLMESQSEDEQFEASELHYVGVTERLRVDVQRRR